MKSISIHLPKSAKARNLASLSPLMKKGGVHDKDNPKTAHRRTRKAMRLKLKQGAWL